MFNDLLEELEKVGVEVFAYADDLAIHGFDEDKLKKVMIVVENWVRKNNMKINKKKSGILFH